MSRSILQRACFADWKLVFGLGLSDVKEMKVGLILRSFFREAVFSEGKFSLGSDDPTWQFKEHQTNGQ